MSKKMIMTEALFNDLLNNLMCVAISAIDSCPIDKQGEVVITDEKMNVAEEYAKETMSNILAEWSEYNGLDWEIK